MINQEKRIWCPVQSIVWLGVAWNFEHGTVAIIDVRIGKIEQRLSLMLQKKLVSRRNWFLLEICAKASTRLYALRILKRSGAPPKNIIEYYVCLLCIYQTSSQICMSSMAFLHTTTPQRPD